MTQQRPQDYPKGAAKNVATWPSGRRRGRLEHAVKIITVLAVVCVGVLWDFAFVWWMWGWMLG